MNVRPKPVTMAVMSPPELFLQLLSGEAMGRLHDLADLRGPVFQDFSSAEARATLAQAEVLITGWGCPPLDRQDLDAAPNLTAVIHAGGVIGDRFPPVPAGRSIQASNAGAANAVPVAEYTLAMILLANTQAFDAVRLYRSRRDAIDREREYPTAGNYRKTVGLVGASRIGKHVARLLQPFQLDVMVYDPYLGADEARALGVNRASLETLMSGSDVVSVHVPVTPETTGMIGAPELALMRSGTTLINTARGEVLDQDALEKELLTGRINAILDVAVPDVLPPGHPFYDLPNVLLTPHIAGSMGTELWRMGEHVVSELERYVSGQPFDHPDVLATVTG
jgi:phosphoglycerate dehydrogenase-like enzyme